MALLLFTCFMFHAQARVTCISGNCNIHCSSQNCDIIICTNQASSCTITCKEGECDTSTFYLAASDYNTVDCNGSDSCNKINIQYGLPNIIPIGYNMSDFIGHINECTLVLRHNAISNGGRVQCIDNIDLCQIYALTDNNDFSASQFKCNLTAQNGECIMSCNANTSCGDGTSSFDCIAPKCQCRGNGCAQIPINTAATRVPTDRPSRTPTNKPIGSVNQYPSNVPTKSILDQETVSNKRNNELDEIPEDMIYILTSILTGIFCMMFAMCCCIRIVYDYQRKIMRLKSVKIAKESSLFKDNSYTSSPLNMEGTLNSLTASVDVEEHGLMMNIVSNTTTNTLPAIPEEEPRITLDALDPMLSNGSIPSLPTKKRLPSLRENSAMNVSYSSQIWPSGHSIVINNEMNDTNLDERMIRCYTVGNENGIE